MDVVQYEHEADIFANQMKHVKPLQPYEVFMANVEAGNPDQLMIRDLVESYGLTIGMRKTPGTVGAVSSLENIYKRYGYHVLNRVLRLCVGAWEGDSNSLCANVLNGVAKLVVTYRNKLNDDVFKEKVGAISVRQLGRQAKERRPGSMGYAEAMIIAYNGKKKSKQGRLLMSKLHSTDFAELTSEDYSDNMLYDEDAEYEEFDEMDDENEEDILDDNADEGFIDPFDD